MRKTLRHRGSGAGIEEPGEAASLRDRPAIGADIRVAEEREGEACLALGATTAVQIDDVAAVASLIGTVVAHDDGLVSRHRASPLLSTRASAGERKSTRLNSSH